MKISRRSILLGLVATVAAGVPAAKALGKLRAPKSTVGWVQRIVGGVEYGLVFQQAAITRMTYVGPGIAFATEARPALTLDLIPARTRRLVGVGPFRPFPN